MSSRSRYNEDISLQAWSLWNNAVLSAIHGRRGQAFLRDLADALDSMETKELAAGVFQENGAVCALGRLAEVRGLDVSAFDEDTEPQEVADVFGIARALAKETMSQNDDGWLFGVATPAQRWEHVRRWVGGHLKEAA